MDSLRPPNVVNRQDLPWQEYGKGRYIRARKDLGKAVGTRGLGIRLEQVIPGRSDVPLHWHLGEEEGFIAVGGEALVLQSDADDTTRETTAFRAGDAVVFPPDRRVGHRLDVPAESEVPFTYLVFGDRAPLDVASYPGRDAWLVRKGTQNPTMARRDGLGMFRPTPIDYYDGLDDADGPEAPGGSSAEAVPAARFGERDGPAAPAYSPVVRIDQVPPRTFGRGRYTRECARLSPHLGAERFDLNLDVIPPGHVDSPLHYHLGDEECFYLLDGAAILHMEGPGWPDDPIAAKVTAGDCISFPPATGIGHQIEVPEDAERPLRMLTLATRAPVDVVRMVHSDKWILKRSDLEKEARRSWGGAIVRGGQVDWLADEPLLDV